MPERIDLVNRLGLDKDVRPVMRHAAPVLGHGATVSLAAACASLRVADPPRWPTRPVLDFVGFPGITDPRIATLLGSKKG